MSGRPWWWPRCADCGRWVTWERAVVTSLDDHCICEPCEKRREKAVAEGKCRSCGAAVIWAPAAATGGLMALDAQTELAPADRLIAFNDETGLCRLLKGSDVREALLHADPNVTFHQNHFATCPHMRALRRPVSRP